jgi:hypothetical protein
VVADFSGLEGKLGHDRGEAADIIRGSMWEAAAIILIVAGTLLWVDSLRARERAIQAGRSACERYALQFLDETVSFARLRLGRDDDGRLRIVRIYTFEFSETGNNRRNGAIVMLGQDPKDIHLEPYRAQ